MKIITASQVEGSLVVQEILQFCIVNTKESDNNGQKEGEVKYVQLSLEMAKDKVYGADSVLGIYIIIYTKFYFVQNVVFQQEQAWVAWIYYSVYRSGVSSDWADK